MKVFDVIDYVKIQVPMNKYLPNMFHSQSPDDSIVVVVDSYGRSSRTTKELTIQFLVRNTDPEQAEANAHLLFNHFNNKTDYTIGSHKVIMSRGAQAVPLYTGVDDNSRHIYSVNIEVLIDTNN